MNYKSQSGNHLLDLFPTIELPITLTEDLIITFSKENNVIPSSLIAEYIDIFGELDELSEIIPCFKLEVDKNFYTIIFWKGSPMSYEYKMTTLSKAFKLIDQKVIAGTLSNGQTIKRSVAHIDENLTIKTMVGESDNKLKYDPNKSEVFIFTFDKSGKIEVVEELGALWR